jgi:hypothetical protein
MASGGIGDWFRSLGHSLTGIFSLLGGLWHKLIEIKDKTLSLFTDVHTLVSGAEQVIRDIQNFEVNPKWNSRVILATHVVDKIKTLYDIPRRIVTDVQDLVRLLREKVQPTEIKLEDVEGLDGVPAKLLRAGEKILGFATLIIDALVAIESAVADLNDIVDALREVLEDLQGLDALFLPQGNRKKTVDEHYRKRQRS